MTETGIDFQQVLREIDEEVRARRAAGDFPVGMERDLDLVFSRFAPATVSGDDLGGLIEAADRTSFVDPHPPVASRIPAVAILKKVEHKLLGWFFIFLAQQITAFNGVVVQALRLVGKRVEALEEATPGANPTLIDAAARARTTTDPSPVADAVASHLEGVTGRVLVSEAGDGALLLRLQHLDVYGVEPSLELAESSTLAGLDVRADGALDHRRAVEAGALGALVLTGAVDRVPLGVKVALLHRTADVLADGGRVALVGTDPDAWGRGNPVEADLAPGRPLHAATWVHLLEGLGFTGARVEEAGDTFAVLAAR